MDCRSFRREHLAYLDDTLSGEQTGAAQRHVMACDGCAAHDTLVRRSLMMARSLQPIEPSQEFQRRLRARLASCRDEPVAVAPPRQFGRASRTLAAVATGTVIGALAWHGLTTSSSTLIAMQPVIATQPEMRSQNSYITPALMQAMATGNPVWPAAVLIEDVPTYFVSANFR